MTNTPPRYSFTYEDGSSPAHYKIGDMIKLNEDETCINTIVCVCDSFWDETGYSKERYYYIRRIGDDRYPPSPIKESAIGEYYTLCIHLRG